MRLPALLVGLLASLPACMADSPDEYSFAARDLPVPEHWYDSGSFRADSFDILWETAKIQACRGGYRIDDDATSLKNRVVITAWKTDLGVHKNEGKRRRRFVSFVEQPGLTAGWRVRVSTVRQRNVDIDDPLNIMAAEWRADEPDTDDAEKVAYGIEAQFRVFGPSKDFEQR
jgi:hypothetical protein